MAVAPFYARSRFGLESNRLRTLLELAESHTVEQLRAEGFELVEPTRLEDELDGAPSWHELWRTLRARDLEQAFEPSPSEDDPPREATRLQNLYRRGRLEWRFVLFGELVYHTATTCRVRAEASRLYVRVGEARRSEEAPRCVVTHLQARIVDARTGRTVWFNRRLREFYLTPSVDGERENLRETIDLVLGGDDGLGPLSPDSEAR